MKSAARFIVFAVLLSTCLAGPAAAQYMKITTDNSDPTRLKATGTTILTITLDTNHDRDNSLQTCNSHTVVPCGATATGQDLNMFSYSLVLSAVGGSVTWGTFTPSDAAYTATSPQLQDDHDVTMNFSRPASTFSGPGLVTIGTVPVTIIDGAPAINIARSTPIDPTGFGTGFGSSCDALNAPNTYILGDPLDICNTGDWFDADGVLGPAGVNSTPGIIAPATASGPEGTPISVSATATDADAGDVLTITQTGKPADLTFSAPPGVSPRTATISGTPGFNDAGTYTITWTVDDGSGTGNSSATATTTLTITNTNRPPVLAQPTNMTVSEGATADQVLNATDPDGDSITFTKLAGPVFMTVTTTTPGTGTATGNIHLSPGFTDSGTHAATVRASDGTDFNEKTLTITVNNVNRAPSLTQPANMTVTAGSTADQVLNATDSDSDPITFTKATGPTFMTVTTTTPGTGTGTGNIHLAPGASDTGTHSASVTASDGTAGDTKSLTITVNGGASGNPVLAQPANMTVDENATADQGITATDPNGDPVTFSLLAGPSFATVTTTSPGTGSATGNIHLAPGFTSSGTYAATVRASDGTLNDDKTLTITVNNVNRAPTLSQPADMTVAEGATLSQSIQATDPDDEPITFTKVSGPTFMTVTTTSPGTGTGTGSIALAPGFADSGTYAATVRASDGAANNDKTITITVTNVNRAPVLAQPSNMIVTAGATADQSISATDPDGDPLTFTKTTGPTFMTVTTTTPGTGTGTGNIHLNPALEDTLGSPYSASVSASDGDLLDTKSLTITVNAPVAGNEPPVLAQPSNMTVNEGATADQVITATDPNGDAISFSKLAGPAFMTVTTTTPGTGTGTGNINLAPGFDDSGTYAATVRASDGSLNDDKTLTITVNNVNRAPTLTQPSNMIVTEGATADQSLTATDPDGDALTFTKATGPTFMAVTTTSPGTGTGTGNIHLAPVVGDAAGSTYSASVTVSDGDLSDTKSLTITVNPAAGGNEPPVLAQPSNMALDEGTTADQVITATDPNGDPISFSKQGGPTFMTVSTTTPGTGTGTGNIHLAPGFADSGTYTGTVRASDGSLNDDKTFTITVNNVNRAPVADAGGPYTGTVGSPVSFSGTGSSDPDGDALTYDWDFDVTDGITVDATGPTPSHTYSATGIYTVTLTVTDNGTPALTDTDTATATISEAGAGVDASIFLSGGNRVIRFNSARPFWCVQIEPVDHSFNITTIIASSIKATYGGVQIPALIAKTSQGGDINDNGILEFKACFSKENIRILFASLPSGRRSVDVTITGDLLGGGSFSEVVSVVVIKGGNSGLAKGQEDDGEEHAEGHGSGKDFSHASPNPFNPNTTISFELSRPGSVRLHIYDVSGRLVKTLADGFMGAGVHSVAWDGTARNGSRVSSGVYFYVLDTPERSVKSQLVMMR